jgi:hypothetical protein
MYVRGHDEKQSKAKIQDSLSLSLSFFLRMLMMQKNLQQFSK